MTAPRASRVTEAARAGERPKPLSKHRMTMTSSAAKPTVRMNFQRMNVGALDRLDSWVEQQILALGRARRIDEANIRMTRNHNSSPPYQVNVHLVTPGPDVHAEATDHTLRAAFEKAVRRLRHQITDRASNRLLRWKDKSAVRSSRGF